MGPGGFPWHWALPGLRKSRRLFRRLVLPTPPRFPAPENSETLLARPHLGVEEEEEKRRHSVISWAPSPLVVSRDTSGQGTVILRYLKYYNSHGPLL